MSQAMEEQNQHAGDWFTTSAKREERAKASTDAQNAFKIALEAKNQLVNAQPPAATQASKGGPEGKNGPEAKGGPGANNNPFVRHEMHVTQAKFSAVEEARKGLQERTLNMDPMQQKIQQAQLKFYEKFESDWGKAINQVAKEKGGLG
jgi:hypothetical protein